MREAAYRVTKAFYEAEAGDLRPLERLALEGQDVIEELRAFLPNLRVHDDHGRQLVVTDGVLYKDKYPELFKVLTRP